jgi:hypothetical protein
MKRGVLGTYSRGPEDDNMETVFCAWKDIQVSIFIQLKCENGSTVRALRRLGENTFKVEGIPGLRQGRVLYTIFLQ